jgi:hypothetical protein
VRDGDLCDARIGSCARVRRSYQMEGKVRFVQGYKEVVEDERVGVAQESDLESDILVA